MSKILLVTIFCILGASLVKAGITVEDVLALYEKTSVECMAETGATSVDIDDMMNERPSSSREGKCFRACLFRKHDIVDSNGNINRQVVEDHARLFTNDDPEKMKIATEVLDKCLAIDVPNDACEAGEKYGMCYKHEATARGIDKLEF